jgi:hypothetical protein
MRAKITQDMRNQLDLMISSSDWPMERASYAASIIGSIRLGSSFFTLPIRRGNAIRIGGPARNHDGTGDRPRDGVGAEGQASHSASGCFDGWASAKAGMAMQVL